MMRFARPLGFVHLRFGALVALTGVLACSEAEPFAPDPSQPPPHSMDAGSQPSQPSGDAALPLDPNTPTFYGEVAPILSKHCVSCHQAGGIGPFKLIEYAEVAPLAALIQAVTTARTMPPFLPDNSGDCATYRDAMWLTDQEIDTLAKWAEAGAPEGDPARGLPPLPELPKLNNANHEARMVESYTPGQGETDDYRCFILEDDIEGSASAYLTDYEVVPGDSRVVHHVIVFQPTSQSVVDELRVKDQDDPLPGYQCFGGVGSLSARMIMNWAPGTGAVHHPAETGVAIDPALPLVMQVHYNVANGAFPDRTSIKLATAESVKYPMRPWFVTDGQLELQPNTESINKSIELPVAALDVLYGFITNPLFANGPLLIMGVRAHMHTLGTKMHVERKQFLGDSACLIDIPNYDFGWQRSYFLDKPVPLGQLDTVGVHCTFDTRGRDVVTRFGEATEDEMCLATLYTIEAESYP